MLSDFQRKKLTHFFQLLDANDDKRIELDDFAIISDNLCVNLGYDYESDEHQALAEKSVSLFHKLIRDIPNSGVQEISQQEWLSFFDKEMINSSNEELLEEYVEVIVGFLFDLFDKNHDGYISVDEYADLFMTYGIDIKYSAKSFVNLDANKDGRLSKNELNHAAETFLVSDDATEKGNWIFGNWDTIQSV